MSAIRTWVLAAGTAALISSQAASAAPVSKVPAVDPLLALSALSTPQSRTAACGASTACAPLATSAALPAAASAAAVQPGAYDGTNRDYAGLAVLFAFPLVLILSMILEDGNDPIDVSLSPG